MKINRTLLPIKAHFFFFMAAMGPILPQLTVVGKELGISSVVMGTITGVLPVAFLLAKPIFGIIVDVFREYRKTIFMLLIVAMTLSFGALNFIQQRNLKSLQYENINMSSLDTCNVTDFRKEDDCSNETKRMICTSQCFDDPHEFLTIHQNNLCTISKLSYVNNNNCSIKCTEHEEIRNNCLYSSSSFWIFVIFMSLGSIGFNVVNSISDAICFDVIGEEFDYGKQRVWGTIGFGVTALIAGYAVDIFSGTTISYTPAFLVMTICSLLDLISCISLTLPIIKPPDNIFKDIRTLMNNRRVVTFGVFAIFAGIVDGVIIYFIFWYLEDLAIATNTSNVKLLEGLIVAAETLGGEVIFFSISGKILERFGHVHCFSMCFIFYALRLGLISVVPSPWWIIPVEFCLQGPTYALTYTTIVAYANELAPPGTSATMQGIAAGLDDGFGYALGSIFGGLLYRYLGGRHTFQAFSALGVVCSIAHLIVHKTILTEHQQVPVSDKNENAEYKNPEEAVKITYGTH